MYLNRFATDSAPLDMTQTDEFRSLRQSAAELGLDPDDPLPRYVSRNVIVNGLRIHLLEWGERGRPAVLLLHGSNQSAHSWDLVSLMLAARYHVVAIDQRGHGDTEWPRDGESTREAMASDAAAIAHQLQLDRPTLIGHSMGGIVGMTLLIAQPDSARRAVIVDIGPADSGEFEPLPGSLRIREFIRSAREFDSIDEFVDRVAAHDPFRPRDHIRRTLIYNLMQTSDQVFVSKSDPRRLMKAGAPSNGFVSRPTLAQMSAVKCPLLVVRGDESEVLTPSAAESFSAAVPHASFVTVPDCGHNVHSQNPTGFLEAIEPFLEDEA